MTLTITPNPSVTFGTAYQDADVVVVEKPARVPTQPGRGHQEDTLLNGLFARFGQQLQNLGKARDFGLLHRLDKETSGLVVVALSAAAYDALRDDFANRRISKFYWAVCAGRPRGGASGVIRLPIVETSVAGSEDRPGPPKTAHIAKVGKPAVTAYRVLESTEIATLIEARPVTGRLHQVRVHLDAIGCPILGDKFYGPRRVENAAPRLALHSHRLVFKHPVSGEDVDARTDWPRDLRRVLRDCGLHRPDLAKGSRDQGTGGSSGMAAVGEG